MNSDDEKRLQAQFNELALDDRLTAPARARLRQTVRRELVQARLDALTPKPVSTRRPSLWSLLFTSPALALGGVGVFALGLIAFAYVVSQQLPPSGAQVRLTNGAALILHADSDSLVSLSGNETASLRPGDVITVTSGNATLVYARDLSTRLEAGAAAKLNKYGNSAEASTVDLVILQGHSETRVDRPLTNADAFVVRSPSSEAIVRGTVFIVETRSNTVAYFATNRGLVQVHMGEQHADVPEDYEVEAVVGKKLAVHKRGPLPTSTPSPTPLPTATASPTALPSPTATPLPTQTPTPTLVPSVVHTVRYGDTLYGIAAQHHVSPEAIMAINPAVRRRPRTLRVGEKILIP